MRNIYAINNMVDFVEGLNEFQLRKVYNFASMLATSIDESKIENLGSDFDNSTHSNMIYNTITKLLGSSNLKSKKIGIIGSCAVIRSIGRKVSRQKDTSFGLFDGGKKKTTLERDLLNDRQLEIARKCINDCFYYCQKLPLSMSILYDELSFIFDEGLCSLQLIENIKAKVGEYDNLLLDIAVNNWINLAMNEKLSRIGIGLEPWFMIKSLKENSWAVNILPNLCSDDPHSYEKLWNMLSKFRLLQTCPNDANDMYKIFELDFPLILFYTNKADSEVSLL